MTSPSIRSSNHGHSTSAITNHVVSLPPTYQAGDYLVILWTNNLNIAPNNPSGWTLLSTVSFATNFRFRVWSKVATGSEGTTVTISAGTAVNTSWITYAIKDTNQVDPILIAGTALDPPLLDAVARQDYLWLLGLAHDDNIAVATYPSVYNLNRIDEVGTNFAVAGCVRQTTAISSDDPTAFTLAAGAATAYRTLHMAFAPNDIMSLGGGVDTNNTSTKAIPLNRDIPAHQAIIVTTVINSNLAVSSVTDTAGHTFTKASSSANTSQSTTEIWHCLDPATPSSSGNIITVTWGGNNSRKAAWAYVLQSPVFMDSQGNNFGNGTNPTVSTIASVPQSDLCFAISLSSSATMPAPPTDTLWVIDYADLIGTNKASVAAHGVSRSAGVVNYAETVSQSGWSCSVVAYSLGGAAAGPGGKFLPFM